MDRVAAADTGDFDALMKLHEQLLGELRESINTMRLRPRFASRCCFGNTVTGNRF